MRKGLIVLTSLFLSIFLIPGIVNAENIYFQFTKDDFNANFTAFNKTENLTMSSSYVGSTFYGSNRITLNEMGTNVVQLRFTSSGRSKFNNSHPGSMNYAYFIVATMNSTIDSCMGGYFPGSCEVLNNFSLDSNLPTSWSYNTILLSWSGEITQNPYFSFYLSPNHVISSDLMYGYFMFNSNWSVFLDSNLEDVHSAILDTNRLISILLDNGSSIEDAINETNKKLDEIQNSDISNDSKELPDDSAYQDYQNKEDQLTDKMNQADMSSVSIGIDSNSSSFIWSTVTSLIRTNQHVFAMFISILSIGIIKLALGR